MCHLWDQQELLSCLGHGTANPVIFIPCSDEDLTSINEQLGSELQKIGEILDIGSSTDERNRRVHDAQMKAIPVGKYVKYVCVIAYSYKYVYLQVGSKHWTLHFVTHMNVFVPYRFIFIWQGMMISEEQDNQPATTLPIPHQCSTIRRNMFWSMYFHRC